jgi:hypothetical protein
MAGQVFTVTFQDLQTEVETLVLEDMIRDLLPEAYPENEDAVVIVEKGTS